MLKKVEDDPPYWLINVPRSQWPTECPDFLRNASERDQKILSTPDTQFRRLTWDEVREIVGRVYDERLYLSPAEHRKRTTASISLLDGLRICENI
jgi:hypothetical protein